MVPCIQESNIAKLTASMEYMAEKIEDVKATVDKLDAKMDQFIKAADEKYVHHEELNAIKKDVETMKDDKAKIAWFVILSVFGALLALVLNR